MQYLSEYESHMNDVTDKEMARVRKEIRSAREQIKRGLNPNEQEPIGYEGLGLTLVSFCAPSAKQSNFWMNKKHAAVAAHLLQSRIVLYGVVPAKMGENE